MITPGGRILVMYFCLKDAVAKDVPIVARQWRNDIKREVTSEDLIIPLIALFAAVDEWERNGRVDDEPVRDALEYLKRTGGSR